MGKIALLILHAFCIQAYARDLAESQISEAQTSMGKLVDEIIAKLANRVIKTWSDADLDKTTLAKPHPGSSRVALHVRPALSVPQSMRSSSQSPFPVCSSPVLSPKFLPTSYAYRETRTPVIAASAAAAAAVMLERTAKWDELEKKLPSNEPREKGVLTLYRDTNGWCPFCERIMLALREKGIAFEEQLINLRDKPKWYTDMVPTKLTPAIKMHDSGQVIWESLDILHYLDEHFPSTTQLMAPNETVSAALARNDAILSAGFRFAYGNRNASLSSEEKQQRQDAFFGALDDVDKGLTAAGPFLAGPRLSGADVCLIPMMERYRWQLPLTAGVNVYDGARWPGIKRWFDAMDSLPNYRDHVAGDEISWTIVTSTFLRLFASGANGTLDDTTKATIAKADQAALDLLAKAEEEARGTRSQRKMVVQAPQDAAVAAATKLIQNYKAVVADAAAGDTESKSQKSLARLPSASAPVVEKVLWNTAARLLGLPPEPVAPAEADTAAQAARYIAQRVCVPRDMGAPAAMAFRTALFQEGAAADEGKARSIPIAGFPTR